MFHLFVLATNDSQQYAESVSTSQNALMRLFFQNVKEHQIQRISRGAPDGDICNDWRGLTCDGGVLRSIVFRGESFANFSIAYAPPTVQELDIARCDQCLTLNTRLLPRASRRIAMNDNNVRGSVDLKCLPDALEELLLHSNAITGSIDLTMLPRSLVTLDLRFNCIEQQCVLYSNLPPNFKKCSAFGQQIRCFQGVLPGDYADGKQVFKAKGVRVR